MGAEDAAYWVVYIVPFLAFGVIWKAYDSLVPKLCWFVTLVFSFIIFSPAAFGGISMVALLINIFVAYFKDEETKKRKKDEMMNDAFKAQRNNHR